MDTTPRAVTCIETLIYMSIDKYILEKQSKKKEKKYNKQIGACINTIMHLYIHIIMKFSLL